MSSGFLDRAMFEAPWWSIFINPHFLPRKALWRAMSAVAPTLRGVVLDVGCGIQPYRGLLSGVDRVIGLELDTPENRARKQADAYYDGRDFPFENASFDAVLCNQVLEHVFEPEEFLAEIARVLRPQGSLVLSVPFVWPEHEQPRDACRYTSYGLLRCLDRGGFDVHSHSKLVSGFTALLALAANTLNEISRHRSKPVQLLARMTLIAPLSMLGALIASVHVDKNATLFLDNFCVARRRPVLEIHE